MSLLDDNILDASDICVKERLCLGGCMKLDTIYIRDISVINKYFDMNMLKKHSRLYGWTEKHDEVNVTKSGRRFNIRKTQKSRIASYINNILLGMIKDDISEEYLKDYFNKFLNPAYKLRPIICSWTVLTMIERITFIMGDLENPNMSISIHYKFLKNDI